jgi:hypothetical protein
MMGRRSSLGMVKTMGDEAGKDKLLIRPEGVL